VVLSYARHLLSPDNTLFLHDFSEAMQPFIRAGLMNSLSQTAIKLTAPGVPDIYQGSEALNFSLVDPDNRREPDFPALVQHLSAADATVFDNPACWRDGGSNSLLPPRCCGFDRTTTRFSATATGCRLRSPASGRRT
jgi:(1->4)-alpha-D-glucan 1-alpha-D-glucosylmutase